MKKILVLAFLLATSFTSNNFPQRTGGDRQLWKFVLQTGHAGQTNYLLQTPDEKYLLSESDDRLIIWETSTARMIHVFEDEKLSDLSADGTMFITADTDEAYYVRDIKTGRILQNANALDNCNFTLSGKFSVCRLNETGLMVSVPGTDQSNVYLNLSNRILEDWANGLDDKIIVSSRVVLDKNAAVNQPRNFLEIYETGQNEPSFTLNDKIAWGISANGRFLIAQNEAKKVEIFDLAGNNKQVFAAENLSEWRLSPQNRYLFGLTADKALKIWSLADGKEKLSDSENENLYQWDMTPDEKYAYKISETELSFYNLETGAPHLTVEADNYSSDFSPNGRFLAVNNEKTVGNVLKLWDLDAKKIIFTSAAAQNIQKFAFSPDSRFLLTEFVEKKQTRLVLREISSGLEKNIPIGAEFQTIIEKYEELLPPPLDIVGLRADGENMLRTLPIELKQSNKQQTVNSPDEASDSTLVFSPSGKTIVRGFENGSIVLWETAGGTQKQIFRSNIGLAEPVLSTDKTKLAISNGLIDKLWDYRNGGFIGQTLRPRSKTQVVPKSNFFNLYEVEPGDNFYRIFNKKTGRDFFRLTNVENCELNDSNKLLACFRKNKAEDESFTLEVYSLQTKRLVFRIPRAFYLQYEYQPIFRQDSLINVRTLNPDDSDFAAQIRLELWNTQGRRLFASPFGVMESSISDDGKHILMAFLDRLEWHNLTTGKIKRFELTEDQEIGVNNKELYPSADGNFLAMSDIYGIEEKQITIWNTLTGDFHTGIVHSGQIKNAVFSPDGRFLITGSDSGVVRFWDISKGQLFLNLTPIGDNDWVLTDGEGRFDFSANAKPFLSWESAEGLPFTFDQMLKQNKKFIESRYMPDLWKKMISGK